jgi:hypothetical protein
MIQIHVGAKFISGSPVPANAAQVLSPKANKPKTRHKVLIVLGMGHVKDVPTVPVECIVE